MRALFRSPTVIPSRAPTVTPNAVSGSHPFSTTGGIYSPSLTLRLEMTGEDGRNDSGKKAGKKIFSLLEGREKGWEKVGLKLLKQVRGGMAILPSEANANLPRTNCMFLKPWALF